MKKKMISLALALLMVLSLLPVTAFADGPTELTIGVKMFGFQINLPPIGSGDFYVTSNPSGYIEVEPSSGTITSGQTIDCYLTGLKATKEPVMFFVIIGGFPMPIVQTFTIKSNHTHSFTYDASGNVLTATCVRSLYG